VKRQTGVDGAPGRPGVVGDDRGRIPAIATALAGSGEGGLGLVFPLVLGGSLLAAAAFIGLRRSHRR
jgi:hypothetical protein